MPKIKPPTTSAPLTGHMKFDLKNRTWVVDLINQPPILPKTQILLQRSKSSNLPDSPTSETNSRTHSETARNCHSHFLSLRFSLKNVQAILAILLQISRLSSASYPARLSGYPYFMYFQNIWISHHCCLSKSKSIYLLPAFLCNIHHPSTFHDHPCGNLMIMMID